MRRRRSDPLASINITPLVDVMLVLLILFLITAGLQTRAVDVNLPRGEGTVQQEQGALTLTVRADGSLVVGGNTVSLAELDALLKDGPLSSTRVFLEADEAVPYGVVAQVLDHLKQRGAERLGLVVRPATP